MCNHGREGLQWRDRVHSKGCWYSVHSLTCGKSPWCLCMERWSNLAIEIQGTNHIILRQTFIFCQGKLAVGKTLPTVKFHRRGPKKISLEPLQVVPKTLLEKIGLCHSAVWSKCQINRPNKCQTVVWWYGIHVWEVLLASFVNIQGPRKKVGPYLYILLFSLKRSQIALKTCRLSSPRDRFH